MASYLRPTRLQDALAILAQAPRAILAGGTDHFPARATHTPDEDIVDITAIPGLRAIVHEEGRFRIPALATWTDLVDTPLPPLFDGLKQAANQIGGRQIQNAGTLVGNVCNASPAADGIPALMALDAVVELRSTAGMRVLRVEDFVLAPRRTARRPAELVTALLIHDTPRQSAFLKLGARRYLVISIAMVAITLMLDEAGHIDDAAIAVGACGPTAIRLPALEAALAGQHPATAHIDPAHLGPLIPIDDIRAPAAYRRTAVAELLRRGLATLAPLQAAA